MTDIQVSKRRAFRFERVERDVLFPKVLIHTNNDPDESSSSLLAKSFEGYVSQNIRITALDDPICSYSFRNCEDCIVSIEVPCSSLFLHGMRSCTITVCGVQGSIQISNSNALKIKGFCGQLRLTECIDILLEIQTNSSTALVNSRGIQISPPPTIQRGSVFYKAMEVFKWDHEYLMSSSKWRDVTDFNCLTGVSPNWSFKDQVV